MKCVTCGEELSPERAEVKNYCMKKECFQKNYRPLKIVEIGQTKTNAEYVILTPEKEKEIAEGRYRRDPIVVGRQKTSDHGPVNGAFKKPKIVKYASSRVRFVQALQAQGYRVDEIVAKGAYMGLTRTEVVRYMTGKKQ